MFHQRAAVGSMDVETGLSGDAQLTSFSKQTFEMDDGENAFSERMSRSSGRSSIRLSRRNKSRNYSNASTPSYNAADEIVKRGDAVRLTWQNVNVYVEAESSMCSRKKKDAQPKQILQNVSGVADPGSVTAIMGSSGAGKSTLLNALTWRNRQNLIIDGEIKVNGKVLEDKITNVSAYVQQDDLFVGAMTVKEHLIFNARLRMDPAVSDSERLARVEEVMDQMGLRKCEDTLIGTPGRSKTISGGEMKRLSFATELLTNPPLLFCDEPTSGLDSYLAKVICECLQRVAKEGCTVLCTIHQPSSEVFELFDKLLLLALGRVIYLGPRQEAENYYANLGMPCPRNFNPADHYIMKISVTPGNEQQCKQKIAEIADQYDASNNKLKIDAEISEHVDNSYEISPKNSNTKDPPRYKVGAFQQFFALVGRASIMLYRDPLVSGVKLGQTIVVSLIIGLVYLRTPYGSEYKYSEITNITGALFLVIINNTFSYVFGVINTFPMEIPLFRREHFNGMYSTGAYYLSKNVAELPMYIILPLIYSVIAYFMIGLYPGVAQFFIFYGTVILLINTCVSFGYWVSCISPSVTIALAIGPPMIMPLLLFGGFFLSADSVPVYFVWLKYLSWFLYTNEILTVNQWQSVTNITCDLPSNSCPVTNGADVIEQLDFNVDNMGMDFGLLIALLLIYRILGYLILLYRMRDSTR